MWHSWIFQNLCYNTILVEAMSLHTSEIIRVTSHQLTSVRLFWETVAPTIAIIPTSSSLQRSSSSTAGSKASPRLVVEPASPCEWNEPVLPRNLGISQGNQASSERIYRLSYSLMHEKPLMKLVNSGIVNPIAALIITIWMLNGKDHGDLLGTWSIAWTWASWFNV